MQWARSAWRSRGSIAAATEYNLVGEIAAEYGSAKAWGGDQFGSEREVAKCSECLRQRRAALAGQPGERRAVQRMIEALILDLDVIDGDADLEGEPDEIDEDLEALALEE